MLNVPVPPACPRILDDLFYPVDTRAKQRRRAARRDKKRIDIMRSSSGSRTSVVDSESDSLAPIASRDPPPSPTIASRNSPPNHFVRVLHPRISAWFSRLPMQILSIRTRSTHTQCLTRSPQLLRMTGAGLVIGEGSFDIRWGRTRFCYGFGWRMCISRVEGDRGSWSCG